METHYAAYVKTINGIPFYFVKGFKTFPEYKNVSPLLETYGMHTNFTTACNIAQVYDALIRQQLLDKIEKNAAACKVIPIKTQVGEIYNMKRRHMHFLSLLKLIGLG